VGDDLAAAKVNRSYQLAASSIAIFTFPAVLHRNVPVLGGSDDQAARS
jgi:hypothetical protein